MKPIAIVTIALSMMLLGACTNQRNDLSDEASMARYRDCMNAMPPGPDSHAVTGAISNSGAGQPVSISAAVSSNAQSQRETDCARIAGWKD